MFSKYMTIFISLGYDCAIAGIIEKTKWRKFSLPFDWVVSYEGVSKVFKNDFKNFVDRLGMIFIFMGQARA